MILLDCQVKYVVLFILGDLLWTFSTTSEVKQLIVENLVHYHFIKH